LDINLKLQTSDNGAYPTLISHMMCARHRC